MKKTFYAAMVLVLSLASCTTVTKTATSVDVNNTITTNSTADLEISEKKISYTHYSKAKERKAGKKNVLRSAVKAALAANGQADVLVAPEYEAVEKRGLFGKRLKVVTVTGYPAKYKNFRNK